jgi:hypothetical protein
MICKLTGSVLRAECEEVLEDWLRTDIMKKVAMSQQDEGHYLPHRSVV